MLAATSSREPHHNEVTFHRRSNQDAPVLAVPKSTELLALPGVGHDADESISQTVVQEIPRKQGSWWK
ncbi:MAG TPA: hypothetical protein DGG94_04295 [Micromonosporaceae bacterium]|nr:hypothetical protein [Micromonosporaceae bacterium]HCU49019.1 hypothetical protein [Micromonosporaceae bacterium]